MIRVGIPSVGVSEAPPPYTDITQNAFTFETQTDSFILQHVRSVEGLGREDNKIQIQRSGGLEAIIVGSKVPKLKTLEIRANLQGDKISTARDKYDALENYIFDPDCQWFGRGGYYFSIDVFDCKRSLRIGGVPNVLPIEIRAYLRFPKATNAKVTSIGAYNAALKRSSLDEDYPVVPVVLEILTPALLPAASVGSFYFAQIVAVSPNSPVVYTKTAGYSEITVLPNGFVVWNVPRLTGQQTVTVRATDSTNAFVERTFTIDIPGNIYADGDSGLRDGNTVLGYGY